VASHIPQERSPNLVSSRRSGFPKIWTIQEPIEDVHDILEWSDPVKQSLGCVVPAGPRPVAVNLVNLLFDLDVGIFRKRLGTRPVETIYMFYKHWYMFAWNKSTGRSVCSTQTIYAHVHSIYKFQSWCIWPWAEAIIASDCTIYINLVAWHELQVRAGDYVGTTNRRRKSQDVLFEFAYKITLRVKRKDTSFLLYLRRVFCINDAYINQSRSYVL
jgi:hypothetical protein